MLFNRLCTNIVPFLSNKLFQLLTIRWLLLIHRLFNYCPKILYGIQIRRIPGPRFQDWYLYHSRTLLSSLLNCWEEMIFKHIHVPFGIHSNIFSRIVSAPIPPKWKATQYVNSVRMLYHRDHARLMEAFPLPSPNKGFSRSSKEAKWCLIWKYHLVPTPHCRIFIFSTKLQPVRYFFLIEKAFLLLSLIWDYCQKFFLLCALRHLHQPHSTLQQVWHWMKSDS